MLQLPPTPGSDSTPEAEARRVATAFDEFLVSEEYPWQVAGSVTSRWGLARVIRVEPARVLHVVGASEMADQLRLLYSGGAIAGWTLQPIPATRTPLEHYKPRFQALPREEGGIRGYKQLVHAGFVFGEEVAACPDSALLRVRNIGPNTLKNIRNIIGGPPAGEAPVAAPRIDVAAVTGSAAKKVSGPPEFDDPVALRSWWRDQRMRAAITRTSREAGGFASFGEDSYFAFPPGVLDGTHRISVGARCVINEFVTLSTGFPGDETPGPPTIRLGDGVVLGRRCELHAMDSIDIGEDVFFGPNVLVIDHNHTDHDPEMPIGHQLPLQTDPVEIGAGSWIGAGAIILAGARIGRRSRVGAGTVVTSGRYPPGSLIVGSRPRVLPRLGADLTQ